MAEESPLWRKAFDGVERRIGEPLGNATSSADFQVLSLKVGRVKSAVLAPVEAVVGFGLHLVGIPSHSEVRDLRKDLTDVQRDLLALRREQVETEDAELEGSAGAALPQGKSTSPENPEA
ncbi:hypothetical protein [Tsukamurella sp. PLM1]|uniref:hypothetical protein n=1 Tax=Tsukamurella sp. PLM1 TaxID=2929795 RepID=UPI00206FE228|nr:hypothetical protein [Tsukamurella sp. PLM1]BDH56535.1 hypothetical protein MTP03_14740 [Tsukamurella sp. PLM1]